MNEISCQICMDLMPLVADGVASEDSRRAVESHIQGCESCRRFFEEGTPPPVDSGKAFAQFRKKVNVLWGMVLMFGIVYGLSLTAGSGLFYNTLLMPAIGALGYGLFRWRSLYAIPLLLYATHFVTNLLGVGNEVLELPALTLWTGIYCLFALLGIVIAWLLHFAFGKER